MKRRDSAETIRVVHSTRNRSMLFSSATMLLLLAVGVAGCGEEDELADSDLGLADIELSGPVAVDHLGLRWQVDHASHQILVTDGDGQIVDRYDFEGVAEALEDIEVTETHVYVLVFGGIEPVIARAGRNDVAPSAWETFPISADNLDLHEVTGLHKNVDGVLSLELARSNQQLPVFTAAGNLDIAPAPQALLTPQTYVRFDVSGYIPAQSDYVPVGPTRLLDTRLNGQQHFGPLTNTQILEVTVADRAGLPQANAMGAAVLNVTVLPQKAGYLTVYPGGVLPGTSNINFAQGEATPGLVIIAPGADGKINLSHVTEQGFSSHILIDVVGYFPPSANVTMIQPKRVFDSRQVPFGPQLAAGTTRDVQVGGIGGVPVQASAIIANLTAVKPAGHGYATVYEAGAAPPQDPSCPGNEIRSLSYTGTTRANLVIIPMSDAGRVTIHTTQSAHYILDVFGWFGPGDDFTPIEPMCLMDTSAYPWWIENGDLIDINVVRFPIPNETKAVFGNLTALSPSGGRGFLQVYPVPLNPEFVPGTSNLNFYSGKTVSNATFTGVSPDREFRVRATLFP